MGYNIDRNSIEGSVVLVGKWKVCIQEPFLNCERIFPTKQKYVKQLLDVYRQDENVLSVVVFGSSVTSACNPWSDVDLYVTLAEEKRIPGCEVETSVDLWTNFTVDERLYREIQKKGVLVYKRRCFA